MAINTVPIPTDNPSGALIGYANLLTAATVSPAATDDSEEASNALTPDTWSRWRPPATTVTAKFQMDATADVDYIAIAAHNLTGVTVLVQTAVTIGGALTDVESITPLDNGALMISFDTRNIREIALTMTLAAANEIGVVYAGEVLQMPRNIYGGHAPATLSQQTKFHNSTSETGQILGRTIIREGLKGEFSWQFLDDQWYRDTFQPFVQAARIKPFFIKWRPDYYSDETIFGQTTSDIKPSNMGGGHRLMSVSLSMNGHSDL